MNKKYRSSIFIGLTLVFIIAYNAIASSFIDYQGQFNGDGSTIGNIFYAFGMLTILIFPFLFIALPIVLVKNMLSQKNTKNNQSK